MFKVSDEDKRAFARDGVVVLRGVISLTDINPVRDFIAERMDTIGLTTTGYDLQSVASQVFRQIDKIRAGEATRFDLDKLPAMIAGDQNAKPLMEGGRSPTSGRFCYEAGCWKISSAIENLALYSNLPMLMADLIQAKELRFFEDTFFARDPNTPQQTAWHQDLDYFKVDLRGRKIIAWLPLDESTTETGGTRYIRGSHLWDETFAANVFFADTPLSGSQHPRLPDIEANINDFDIVQFNVEPGDIIVHDVMTIHGATGNLSSKPRRAISFRYCDQDVRYYERPGTINQTGLTHNLKTNDPLNCDDYPLVFVDSESS